MLKLFIALCLLTTSVFAQRVELEAKLLSPSQITKLIGQYPKLGTPASAEDFNTLLHYQQTRTQADCDVAAKDENTSLENMFGGEHNILSQEEVAKMKKFLLKAYAGAGANAYLAKAMFKRPRPYLANSKIIPCISLEKSYAYPSGHTLVSRLYARILSQVYPERAELLMERANAYAHSRILGGVHHPTDVQAGFVLADHLATKMIQDEDFMSALYSL